jgi:ribonuclease VapC
MSYVLDASALLAVLLDEPGGDFVFSVIRGSQISVVNLSEVFSTLLDGGMSFEDADEIISPLHLRVRTFREGHAWQVAKLRPITRGYGLSLGDRACITQAIFSDLIILTSDRRMAEAQAVLDINIQMIR